MLSAPNCQLAVSTIYRFFSSKKLLTEREFINGMLKSNVPKHARVYVIHCSFWHTFVSYYVNAVNRLL